MQPYKLVAALVLVLALTLPLCRDPTTHVVFTVGPGPAAATDAVAVAAETSVPRESLEPENGRKEAFQCQKEISPQGL